MYAAVSWAIQSKIHSAFPSTVGARPSRADFLGSYGLAEYNTLLLAGFNTNIESLDRYCALSRKLQDFWKFQNDQPRHTLK
jgi:hypothetical protein